ncbi:MAG: GNAT family N-acetyltransferase, partial [Butyrivibrio sp.]|nr:GNAT family N-acetyltransferase [Butyrivibrio sp.]
TYESIEAVTIEEFIPNKKTILVVTDKDSFAKKLMNAGVPVVGVSGDFNKDQEFDGLKYVFAEIDEVDIDSYVKAYQRYVGEPWFILETERLILRETTLEDVDEFYSLYKDPEMTQYMEGLFENPEDEKRYQKDYIDKVYGLMGFGIWTVIRKEDKRIIGRAGFSVRNGFDEIELGFLIGKEFQRKGYAFEACSAIMDYGKNILLFDKVQTLVKAENQVSIHICEKLGFKTIDIVDVEENIYGKEYKTDKNIALSQAHFGKYVRMVKFLW